MLSPGATPFNIARPSLVLTAAFVSTAEIVTAGAEYGTLYFSYTRGGAAGAFDFQIQISPFSLTAQATANAAGEWASQGLYEAGALAAGVDTASAEQREAITYTATGAGMETFVYGPFKLEGLAERLRVVARESGNVGAPGLLQAELRLS